MHWDLTFGDFFMAEDSPITLASCLAETSDWPQGKPDEGETDQVNLSFLLQKHVFSW